MIFQLCENRLKRFSNATNVDVCLKLSPVLLYSSVILLRIVYWRSCADVQAGYLCNKYCLDTRHCDICRYLLTTIMSECCCVT